MKFCSGIKFVSGFGYALCTCMVALQLFHFVRSWISPTITNTYVEEIQLKDMDFLLDILLCVKPSLNLTALREIGYKSPFNYVVGNTNPNIFSFSWGD